MASNPAADDYFPKWFVFGAGVILAVAGVAKVWTAFGRAKILWFADPLVGIEFRDLMLAAGLVELSIAFLCFCSKKAKLATFSVAWLALALLVYRLGVWYTGWKSPCGCLGDLTEAIHISPKFTDNIMKILLAYLLIGSYGLLFWEWLKGRKLRVESGRLSAMSVMREK